MSKLSNTTWNKTEKIIKEQLPSFAGSFIRSSRNTMKCRRMSQRSIQVMIKKYSSAAFGDEKAVVGKDLSYSFKDQVYNTSKSLSTTAILSGNSPNTLYKIYKADLNERTTDTAKL